jgi:hypothetical protein
MADPTTDRPAVELQLVATHVDHDLSAVSFLDLVELSGNHDPQTRGILFVHRDKKKMSLSETEDSNFGGVIKINRRQVADVRWNIKSQIFGLQIGARYCSLARGGRKADSQGKDEATHHCEIDVPGFM